MTRLRNGSCKFFWFYCSICQNVFKVTSYDSQVYTFFLQKKFFGVYFCTNSAFLHRNIVSLGWHPGNSTTSTLFLQETNTVSTEISVFQLPAKERSRQISIVPVQCSQCPAGEKNLSSTNNVPVESMADLPGVDDDRRYCCCTGLGPGCCAPGGLLGGLL